ACRYLDDIPPPRCLHLGVIRSVHAHARVLGVRADEARACPGVVAAWTAADLDESARTLPTAYGGSPKGRPWAIPVLARDVARYVGEPLAIVIADDAYRLADAVESVVVEYEPLPVVTDAADAQHGGPTVHAGWPDNIALGV